MSNGCCDQEVTCRHIKSLARTALTPALTFSAARLPNCLGRRMSTTHGAKTLISDWLLQGASYGSSKSNRSVQSLCIVLFHATFESNRRCLCGFRKTHEIDFFISLD